MTSQLSDRDLLARMIALDTTSARSNRALAELIAGYVDPHAHTVELLPSAEGGKANLVILLGPESADNEAGMTLSGHMDTVPAGEPGWSSDPFLLRDGGDRLYGRGTADMKGFLAISLNAAIRAAESGLGHPLAFVLTYDEEVGCLGAHAMVESRPAVVDRLPRPTLIGEPTSMSVVRMHKGHTKLRVEVPGTSAHSGYPHLGVNAIERAGNVIESLSELRLRLESERSPSSELFDPVPWPPLNLATIKGGSAINIVPDSCEIELGLRPLPGMDQDALIEALRAAVLEGCSEATIELINASPPMESSETVPLHRSLCEINGQEGSRAVSFATDAGWLQKLGLECVIWGPGAIEVAHKPDEFIPVDEMNLAADRLDELIEKMCGRST